MNDRRISVSATCAVAYAAWVFAFALMGAGVVFDRADVRAVALMCCMVAMTATIRSYMIGLGRKLKNAFELGQDSVAPMIRRF